MTSCHSEPSLRSCLRSVIDPASLYNYNCLFVIGLFCVFVIDVARVFVYFTLFVGVSDESDLHKPVDRWQIKFPFYCVLEYSSSALVGALMSQWTFAKCRFVHAPPSSFAIAAKAPGLGPGSAVWPSWSPALWASNYCEEALWTQLLSNYCKITNVELPIQNQSFLCQFASTGLGVWIC